MRFSIRNAAAHERSRTGRKARVDDVNIERNGESGGRGTGDFYRIFDTREHSAPVDVAHCKEIVTQAEVADFAFFAQIQIARADVRTEFRVNFRRKAFEG